MIQMYDTADAWPGAGGIHDENGNRLSYSLDFTARRTDSGEDFADYTIPLTSQSDGNTYAQIQ